MRKIKPTIIVHFVLCLFLMLSCKDVKQKTESSTSVNKEFSSFPFTSKMTKPDKKKYYNNGTVIYEIKYKPDGFKLRTSSSKLLWKLKLYDKKIKISNNEENLNPYEIKILEPYKAKLEKDDATIVRTMYDKANNEQAITYLKTTKTVKVVQPYTPSLLIKGILEIPEDQKQILIKELIAKGY